jgi:hypothetical protein
LLCGLGGCAGGHSLLISAIPKVLWCRIYCQESKGLDRGCRCQNRVHHTRLTLGERLLRKLQRPLPPLSRFARKPLPGNERAAQWRGVLHVTRGPAPHQALAPPLQYCQAPQRLGLSPSGAGKHDADRPEAYHAQTFKLDHPMGALHWLRRSASRLLKRICLALAKLQPVAASARYLRVSLAFQPSFSPP